VNARTEPSSALSGACHPFFSIVIPTYNRSHLLRHVIERVQQQSFHDFEIIVSDDCSTDDTSGVVRSMTDERIRYFRNVENRGYPGNVRIGASYARGEVLYLLGDDDLLLAGALARTFAAFQKNPAVGVVTRPYYWFIGDPAKPVRHIPPLDPSQDVTVCLRDGPHVVEALFESAAQLSGLAYRRSDLRVDFHDDIFPCHVYPFADILKRSKAVFLKGYTVAVRTEISQSRSPKAYVKSPAQAYIEMFESVYSGEEWRDVRETAITQVTAGNPEGLLQLRHSGNTALVVRELSVVIRRRPSVLTSARFLSYALLALLMPASVLRRLVDVYKKHILSRSIDGKALTAGL
jgi:glycosyltransferase involved in cell wall biosynthesis